MSVSEIIDNPLGMLKKDFNQSKFLISFPVVNSPLLKEIQAFSRNQCLGKNTWPEIEKVDAWMLSAETATFMKIGGLGMIASELPEAFNRNYNQKDEKVTIVTPLYLGDTGKKRAVLDGLNYTGAEGVSIKLEKILTIKVPFMGKVRKISNHKVSVYKGSFVNTEYIFLSSDRFFSINPHEENPPEQEGCYVKNEFGINEVERFAFYSKAVFVLLKETLESKASKIKSPNIIVANDWHAGALAGLTKYFTLAQAYRGEMSLFLAEKIKKIPIIHIAHHLGYQGWDYKNTSKILNSLYEGSSMVVFKNAKAIKNTNPRSMNTLIVSDCYNQASSSFLLADRVVTVSRNYLEEVSTELTLGYDFRDILKIRKDHRNFFGIVNGYDKKLISPNQEKIKSINEFFNSSEFVMFSAETAKLKERNKVEFIRILSKIAKSQDFAKSLFPKLDLYKFEDISDLEKNIHNIPIISATSRLVEQKGYDIAVNAIIKLVEKYKKDKNFPIFLLGGAGGNEQFNILKKLKDSVTKINPEAGRRVFVFHGYKDEFAYSIQLASDFFMMPSKFEPCGLTQMEAMAKGALPVVTATGGLVDTVEDGVTGFRTDVFFVGGKRVFGTNLDAKRQKNNTNAYANVLEKAIKTFYKDLGKIKEMRIKAMEKDFSWEIEKGAMHKYHTLFHLGYI